MKALNSLLLVSFCLLLFSSCGENKQIKKEPSKINLSEYTGNLSSGTIQRIDSFPSKFVRPRTVDVWLPDGYSEKEKYAVLYMHDGQMLFDSTATWNKQEWKVDEIVGGLIDAKKIKKTIVVAIWNISEIRFQDYYPEKTWEFISKEDQDKLLIEGKKTRSDILWHSDNYLKFITQEVKSYVDSNYFVHTDSENTVIAGSSMGGLISMYAMFEYPEVFGGAACVSTHWCGASPRENNPMTKSFFEYMKSKPPYSETQKFYFDYGTETLDGYYAQYAETVDVIFESKGFDESNYKNLKFEGHDHSENSWNKRFQIPVEFLLKK